MLDINEMREKQRLNNTTSSKRTMVISAFPGCGKTYLYENQDKLEFNCQGERKKFTFCDSDSSHYKKHDGWEKEYVEDIEKKLGILDFIFISQHDKVLEELNTRKIPFVIVAPDNAEWLSSRERELTKQQWFGRFVLRDNSHIKDFPSWLESLKEHYDEWTSYEHLEKYKPVSIFSLGIDQYLSDIISDLYAKKETYALYTIYEPKEMFL